MEILFRKGQRTGLPGKVLCSRKLRQQQQQSQNKRIPGERPERKPEEKKLKPGQHPAAPCQTMGLSPGRFPVLDRLQMKGKARVSRTVEEMGSQQEQQQRQRFWKKKRHRDSLSGSSRDPKGTEQNGDHRNPPAAEQTDWCGRNFSGLLVKPELSMADQIQHTHETWNPEDQNCSGERVVFSARADEPGLNDSGNQRPEP